MKKQELSFQVINRDRAKIKMLYIDFNSIYSTWLILIFNNPNYRDDPTKITHQYAVVTDIKVSEKINR